jgi:hypothetical protein
MLPFLAAMMRAVRPMASRLATGDPKRSARRIALMPLRFTEANIRGVQSSGSRCLLVQGRGDDKGRHRQGISRPSPSSMERLTASAQGGGGAAPAR